jgi:hypothetical protein
MRRLVTLTATATVVLLLVNLTGHRGRPPGITGVPASPTVVAGAAAVASDYLTALLTGDLAAAEAVSTPLLAAQLAAQPPQPGTVDRPSRIDLLTLDERPGSTDLAAELRWPDGRIAAMRVQLVLLDGGWLVAGVQP